MSSQPIFHILNPFFPTFQPSKSSFSHPSLTNSRCCVKWHFNEKTNYQSLTRNGMQCKRFSQLREGDGGCVVILRGLSTRGGTSSLIRYLHSLCVTLGRPPRFEMTYVYLRWLREISVLTSLFLPFF